MVSVGETEAAKSLIDRVVRLVPGNKDIQKLKDKLDSFENLKEQFDKLDEDDSIHNVIKALIAVEIIPESLEDNDLEKDAHKYFGELRLLEEYHFFQKYIKRLKNNYSDLYAVKAHFFDEIRDSKSRKKMLRSYRKKLSRYEKILEGFKDFFFDGDEDEYYDEYYDNNEFFHNYEEPRQPYVREQPKIGRNEPCPCGSGKKYKKCCGR